MSTITFDRFDAGLDLRKGASVSDANRLRVLDNCFVTTGRTIRKRPCLSLVAQLEPGTVGLRAAGGKLNTFHATGSITHADTRFLANKIAHPTLPAMELQKIHFADSFNGYLYVSAQYNNNDIRHHYLDGAASVTAWVASTALGTSAERRPSVDNGFRYEVTTAGVTAAAEPTWPTTPGDSVTEDESAYTAWSAGAKKDNGKAYRPSVSTGFVYQCTNGGVSGPTEPAWPTTVDATVTENGTSEIAWDDNQVLSLGALRRPTTANGFVYEVTTAGTTGATEPAWPTVPGNTVVNGTVTFTCRGQGPWAAGVVLAAGAIRKPTAANNYWYEVTIAGATGNTEPTWPTTVGATVAEKDATAAAWAATTALSLGAIRRPMTANGYLYEVTTAGTTGGSQPTWPTTPGATVVNGTVTFTCRDKAVYTCREKAEYKCVARPSYKCHGSEIYDANCPHTDAVVKKASKIFAVGAEVVRFTATNAPRDWTTASNAGFLGVGVQQSGSVNPTALGEYGANLVTFFSDSAQVWEVDPDPANMKFVQRVDVGCPYPYGAANMAGDVFFASYDGVRSITTQATTGSLIDVDVGSPIDSVLKPSLTPAAAVRSFYFRGGGQFWTMIGSTAYVYSFSRTSKISAWSRYNFPFAITDVTEQDGDLYFRAGNTVYRFDEAQYDDAGMPVEVVVEFPFLDFQAPGSLKQVLGMDAVMVGTAGIAHRFDARTPALITPEVELSGDSRPGELTPVEVCSVGVAPVITHSASEAFELHALTYHFESLGVMS